MTLTLDRKTSSCDCDQTDTGQALIRVDEALALISKATHTVAGSELVDLNNAKGRVLAAPVFARANLPPFDNSAMDGYAVNTDSLHGDGPWRLDVTDRIPAGQTGQSAPPPNGAVRIFTGAPVPQAFNAVVKQEDVTRVGDTIILTKRPRPGNNLRFAGEERAKGDLVLPSGMMLDDRAVAACAASGNGAIDVIRKLRVSLVVTGNEIRDASGAIEGAGIWDVNKPMLCAALNTPRVDLQVVKNCPDTRLALTTEFCDLAETSDLIITTGAVSVGEEDHARPAFAEAGGEIVFNGVAIKPGKPVSFGRIGHAIWLGLPGNPLSAYVTWQLFGKTTCNRLAGLSEPEPPMHSVILGNEVRHREGRAEFRLAKIDRQAELGRTVVTTDVATHSGQITSLHMMDGVVVIPADTGHLPVGALADFLPFSDC